MDCIFCKIIAGEIPCSKVYEDSLFIAFLDIKPVHKGHVLIVPKKHFVNVFDTPDLEAEAIYKVARTLSEAVVKATGCDGINLVQNNNAAAGQEVFHSHMHVIPRFDGDKLRFASIHKEYDSFDEMGVMAEKIKESL
ncbi:MAG: HIT family protein [Denitrovibrio sp.]|nr:MAG: HIT family protein [Denitrovibrio sp.]